MAALVIQSASIVDRLHLSAYTFPDFPLFYWGNYSNNFCEICFVNSDLEPLMIIVRRFIWIVVGIPNALRKVDEVLSQ